MITRASTMTARYASFCCTRGSRSGRISSAAVARRIDAAPMQRAGVVDIALRQLELDLGLEARMSCVLMMRLPLYFTRSMPSLASSSSSIITSLPLALRSLGSYLIGQPR